MVYSVDKLADHAMPCRAALHAQRHPKEHVAIDAGWGPIVLSENPKTRDPGPRCHQEKASQTGLHDDPDRDRERP